MLDPQPSSRPTEVRPDEGGVSDGGHVPPEMPRRRKPVSAEQKRTALIFGSLAAVGFAGIIFCLFYYEASEVRGTLPKFRGAGGKSGNALMNVSAWRLGDEPAKDLDDTANPDIGWWTRHFDLPRQADIIAYFKGQGLTIAKLVPLHYESTKDDTTITYQVFAEVPQQLMRVRATPWQPKDPDLMPFSHVLVLNDGLEPGMIWDTQGATIAADAGSKLNFSWEVKWDKDYNTVTTDRLPFEDGVFGPAQIAQFQATADRAISRLQGRISQIEKQVDAETEMKLAQLPTNLRQRELNRQRAKIKQDAAAQKAQKLQDLANAISSSNGHIAGASAPASTGKTPPPSSPANLPNKTAIPIAAGVDSPIKAAVVDPNGNPSKNGIGNIQVTYFNGKKQVVSEKPNSSQPRLSGKGDIGWVFEVGEDPKFGRDKDILTVHLADGSVKTFQANALFIEDWAFADNDTAVVLRSSNGHGGDSYMKRDIRTGKTIDRVDQASDNLPPWAQPISGPR